MNDKWYDELGNDAFLSDENKEYKKMLEKIMIAVNGGVGLDEACNSLEIKDGDLKANVCEDALKVLIAQMHFEQKMATDKIAGLLKISVERVNAARESMLAEIEEAAIREFHKGSE